MVCLGNICRSPLAEGILQSKLPSTKFVVDSAGTSNYHIGDLPDSRSINIAQKNNIDISCQRARQFQVQDFDNFDLIYAMDSYNLYDIIKLARNETDRSKVKLILNELYPNSDMEVPDPYYGGKDGFQNVFNLLDNACDKIVDSLNS